MTIDFISIAAKITLRRTPCDCTPSLNVMGRVGSDLMPIAHYFFTPNLNDLNSIEDAVEMADVVLADPRYIEPFVFVSSRCSSSSSTSSSC